MRQRPSKLRRAPEDTGSAPSSDETNGATCQQGDISHCAQNSTEEPSLDKLPEDILHHIHSLLHMQDAARAACVSRVFLGSWRCYPNLLFNDRTLGLTDKKLEEAEINLIHIVDHILENHYENGVNVKKFALNLHPYKNINSSYLDRWLQISVKSGTEELYLTLYPVMDENYYNFPCSVLSDKAAASSIESLLLTDCTFHDTSTLGCLKRLKSLELSMVHITEEGLGHFLSKSFALERLVLHGCSGIICLRIPFRLQQLKNLSIRTCEMTQVVEIDAPNLCTLYYNAPELLEISVRNSSQLKYVDMWSYYTATPGILSYARARLPSIAPNVEILILSSCKENVDTPMLPSKLINLKELRIGVLASVEALPLSYDVLSLVSFLDASPVLETFILWVEQDALRQDHIVGDEKEYPRRKPECRHNSLRVVAIMGFCSVKSLVELTIHILESAPSLQYLTLDTYPYYSSFSNLTVSKTTLAEATKAAEVAGRYIAGRVPSGVEFQILEPHSRCHTGNL